MADHLPNRSSQPAVLPTLLDYFQHWEKTRPDAIFMTQPVARDRTVDYTWKQVGEQVRRMAAHLHSLKLPPNSQIAILGKNSAHWIMADLAIWAAGHVSVPLYPTANAETVRYVLEHSEARLLFVGKMDEFWPIAQPGIPASLPCISLPLAPCTGAESWDEIVARTAPLATVAPRAADELATIIYTSGSTGKPKGVMIGFHAMCVTARGLHEMFPITTQDRCLSYLPLAHAAERAILESPALYHGFRVYFAWSLDTFMDDLRRARPTLFFSVPRLWTKFYLGVCEKLPPLKQKALFRLPLVSRLVKRKIRRQLGLEHARAAITGSAPLAPALVAWYREIGLELLEGYALSENFAYSHGNRPGDVGVGSVGRCNPGVECRIADNGEILVKSPANMLGYYKDPQKSADDLPADGFLRTGDMGELDANGRLKITGRVKELFKTAKGKYVAPVPIENRLGNHPAIEIACVTGVGMPSAFALIQLAPELRVKLGQGADRAPLEGEMQSLLKSVNAALEPHEQLGFLAVVNTPWTMENGFLTPTMKIRRGVIEQRYQPLLAAWSGQRREVIWE